MNTQNNYQVEWDDEDEDDDKVPIVYAKFLKRLPNYILDIVNSYNSAHRGNMYKVFKAIERHRTCLWCRENITTILTIKLNTQYFCSNLCQTNEWKNVEMYRRLR